MKRTFLMLVLSLLLGACGSGKNKEQPVRADSSSKEDITGVQSGDGSSDQPEVKTVEPKDKIQEPVIEFDRIAYEKDGFVWLVSPDGKMNEQIVEGRLINWSPNGKRIFYFTYQNGVVSIKVLDRSTAKVTTVATVSDMLPKTRKMVKKWLPKKPSRLEFNSFSGCFFFRIAKQPERNDLEVIGESSAELPYLCTAGRTSTGRPFLDCTCISFSPDSQKVAFDLWIKGSTDNLRGIWSIYVADTDKGTAVKLTDGNAPVFSPDGQSILFRAYPFGPWKRSEQFSSIKTDGQIETPTIFKGYYPTWFPDSKSILYSTSEAVPGTFGCGLGGPSAVCAGPSWRARLRITGYTIDELGLPKWVGGACGFPSHEEIISRPMAFSPSGEKLAFVGTQSDGCSSYLGFWDIETKKINKVRKSGEAYELIRPGSWSPDSSKVMILWTQSRGIETKIVEVSQPTVIMNLPKVAVRKISWSLDSRRLVYESEGGIFIADTETKTITALVPGENPIWCPAQ